MNGIVSHMMILLTPHAAVGDRPPCYSAAAWQKHHVVVTKRREDEQVSCSMFEQVRDVQFDHHHSAKVLSSVAQLVWAIS